MRKTYLSAAVIVVFALSSFVRADDQGAQDDEAIALARQLSHAVARQDTTSAAALFDMDGLFERISTGVNAPANVQAAFKRSFFLKADNFVGGFVKGTAGADYHFLHVRYVDGETHAVFRLLRADGDFTYHDWILGKDGQGRLKIQDAYMISEGDRTSQTMRRAYWQVALLAGPAKLDREYSANMAIMTMLLEASKNGQYKKVLDSYKTLPKSMQEDKICMVPRMKAAQRLRKELPEEYTSALADYQQLYPRDPSVDLVRLDAQISARQFVEARQSIDRLETFTGGDPYLLILCGNTYLLAGGAENIGLARQSFRKAIEEEPTLAAGYWALVKLSLVTSQYDQTAALLTEIQQKLHMKLEDLTTLPRYDSFVKSDAYKKWIADQSGGHAGT